MATGSSAGLLEPQSMSIMLGIAIPLEPSRPPP
jgi:hypothetical protein